MKYSLQPSGPLKVLVRKGSRDRAHSGPCSVMQGFVGMKYLRIISLGDAGSRRAWQKDVAVLRRRSSLALSGPSMVLGLTKDLVRGNSVVVAVVQL